MQPNLKLVRKKKRKKKEKKKENPSPQTQWKGMEKNKMQPNLKPNVEKKKKKHVLERAKGLTMDSMYVRLFTKMSWKLNFDNLKTPKMCF